MLDIGYEKLLSMTIVNVNFLLFSILPVSVVTDY